MNVQQEISSLKEQVQDLQSKLSDKYATVEAANQLKESLAAIEGKYDLIKRLSNVEKQQHSWKSIAKFLVFAGPILGVVMGAVITILGYKSFDAFIRAQVDKHLSYYSTLSAGLVYKEKQPQVAVGYLLQCFDERPFEEPVVSSLLEAADAADDWETPKSVLDKLYQHPTKLAGFTEPGTQNIIGVTELNLAFADPARLENARKAFERGIRKVSPQNSSMGWWLHANFWRYYLAKEDSNGAKVEVEAAKKFETPLDADPWLKAQKWTWFQEFFNHDHKIKKADIESMWTEMYSQAKARQPTAE